MKRRQGFTLIELLVVIAIIAILAAILFPVLAKSRKRALRTVCINNVKQINTAFRLYADDNDSTFPVHWDCLRRGIWGDIDVEVSAILIPYLSQAMVKNAKGLQLGTGIWLCPEDKVGGGPLGADRQARNQERRTSYWYNQWLSNTQVTMVKKSPARCVLTQDNWIDTHTKSTDNPRAWNVSYVDGHCEWRIYPEPWWTDIISYSGYNSAKTAVTRKEEHIYNSRNL